MFGRGERGRNPSLRAGVRGLLALVATVAVLGSVLVGTPPAQAANPTAFNPGNIIDDALFYNGNAMTAAQVQQKLNELAPPCKIGTPPYMPGALSPGGTGNIIANNCLRDFRMSTPSRPANNYCQGYAGKVNETVAEIIAKVGSACGISQKALIVMLEKEQGLVRDAWPVTRQYNFAMGMNCPDSGPDNSANCNSDSAGFFLQVYLGARQLKMYEVDSYIHAAGNWYNIRWHPNASCGTSQVFIENAATAGLYTYTPYRPNAAAIDAGYGTGDGCSTYGNRNFNKYYTDWFGPTHASPIAGDLHSTEVVPTPTGVAVRGWAGDATAPANARNVQIYMGSVGWMPVANKSRPDGKAGFQENLMGQFTGLQRLCAYSGVELGCADVNFGVNAPTGDLNTARVDGSDLVVTGWGVDADRLNSGLEVHVTVGSETIVTTASKPRPDVAVPFPQYGANRGYELRLNAAKWAGTTQSVCAYGINLTPGGYRHEPNPRLGGPSKCLNVAIPANIGGQPPTGRIDGVSVVGNQITLSGWSYDPDFSGSNDVTLTLGTGTWKVKADQPRPDVQQAFGLSNDKHGFTVSVPIEANWPNPGSACLAGDDVNASGASAGPAVKLGCIDVAWIQDAYRVLQ